MPFTFTHPLAVLPLRRFCPKRLDFPALVTGSIAPDFGYYIQRFDLATFAHGWKGLFMVCLPAGLLLLAVFHALRRPLCHLLPQPHRQALTKLNPSPPWERLPVFLKSVLSLLLGALTHIIWDSFTHQSGAAVQRLEFLQTSISVFGTSLPVYYLLQQFSTAAGGMALIILYALWLRRQKVRPSPRLENSLSDRHRYLILLALILISLAVTLPFAAQMAARYEGLLAFRVLVFRTGVYATAVFIPLVIISAMILYSRRQSVE